MTIHDDGPVVVRCPTPADHGVICAGQVEVYEVEPITGGDPGTSLALARDLGAARSVRASVFHDLRTGATAIWNRGRLGDNPVFLSAAQERVSKRGDR